MIYAVGYTKDDRLIMLYRSNNIRAVLRMYRKYKGEQKDVKIVKRGLTRDAACDII